MAADRNLTAAWAAIGLSAIVSLGTVTKDYLVNRTEVTVTSNATAGDVAALRKQYDDMTKALTTLTEQMRDVAALRSQGGELAKALTDLNYKIALMPTTRSIEVVSSRIDSEDMKISDLYNITTGLRHDVDNIRQPTLLFRNPPKCPASGC